MKTMDVQLLREGIQRDQNLLNRMESEMEGIDISVEKLAGMEDSLKGEGGGAIRSFYRECHLPFPQFSGMFKGRFESS